MIKKAKKELNMQNHCILIVIGNYNLIIHSKTVTISVQHPDEILLIVLLT